MAPRESLWRRAIATLRTRVVGDLEARVAAAETAAQRREEVLAERLGGLAEALSRLGAALYAVETRLASSHSELEARLPALEGRLPVLEGRVATLQAEVTAEIARLGVRVDAQRHLLQPAETRLEGTEARLAQAEARLEHLEAHTVALAGDEEQARSRQEWLGRIDCVTALVRAASPSDTLISVILPTRDRAALLAQAMASVQGQAHDRWELLVVDAGSRDGTRELLARQADPRIRALHPGPLGAAAARNRGLAEARGTVVAYLDDDNTMAPDWLRAVAWAFDHHPTSDVLYGAQVVEDGPSGESATPLERRFFLRYEPWSRERLERGNFIDLGAVAHRSSLAEARFDEEMEPLEDWDLLLRLTGAQAPLSLPALSGVYRVHAARRATATDPSAAMARVKAKLAAAIRTPVSS